MGNLVRLFNTLKALMTFLRHVELVRRIKMAKRSTLKVIENTQLRKHPYKVVKWSIML